MRSRQSLITWGIVLALLIGGGLLTILWPALASNFGDSATRPIPTGPETIVIPLPIPIAGRSELVFQSWQLMGIIAFLVIGAVITGGIVLAIINWLLSRIVTNTKDDPEYLEDVAALERNNNEEIKAMRATRPTHSIPDTTWSRWAVVTTSLAILMFVAFFALLIANSLFPESTIVWQDTLVNITAIVTLAMVGIALVVLFFTARSRRLAPSGAGDLGAVPWDTIVVILSGLLVVGIGIGVILLLNSPS